MMLGKRRSSQDCCESSWRLVVVRLLSMFWGAFVEEEISTLKST